MVENGSRGISLRECHGAQVTEFVAKNARGPFPGGSGIQFEYSDDVVIDTWYNYNDIEIAWPEDSMSAYRSNNLVMKNGVVEGSNAPTGWCLMFEGSNEGNVGGLI